MRGSFPSRTHPKRGAGLVLAGCMLFLFLASFAHSTFAANVRTAGPYSGITRGGTVTVLDDGRIIAFGGGTASVWNPEQRQWTLPPDAQRQPRRYLQTATRINGDERIVFVGGLDAYGNRWNQQTALSSVTIWRPKQDIWEAGPGLLAPRFAHAAVALPGGDVLVIGGTSTADHDEPFGPFLASVERLSEKTTIERAPMSFARVGHTATVLPDGRVIVVGGIGNDRSALVSVEIYDPTANTWTAGPPLAAARSGHTASLLPDGRVLVSGGTDSEGDPVSRAELWSSSNAGQWQTAGELLAPRSEHIATVLNDGGVLLSGGFAQGHVPARTLEVWHPATGAWEVAGESPLEMRDHQAAAMPDGSVLLFGADSYVRNGVVLVWLPQEEEQLHLDSVVSASLTSLGDGRVLLTGGSRRQSASASASVYNFKTSRWTSAAPMHFARSGHESVRLEDGRVLVAGGIIADNAPRKSRPQDVSNARPLRPRGEIWDPRTNRWTFTDDIAELVAARTANATIDAPARALSVTTADTSDRPLPAGVSARDYRRTVRMSDGTPLLIVNDQRTFVWNEQDRAWTPVARDSRWTGLAGVVNAPDGRTFAFRSAEMPGRSFGRLEAVWLNTRAMRWEPNTTEYVERELPAVLPLTDDQVMVAGGATAVVQVWNASTNTWRYSGWLPEPLRSPAISSLKNGEVIVAGKTMGDEPTVICALWNPDTERWSVCGQFPSDATGERRAPVLRDLGAGQTLLVHGNERAMVRAADGTWTATKLDFPKSDSVPYPNDQATPYTTDIGSVWNPLEQRWMDATDVLFIHRLGMQAVRTPEKRWLFASRGTVLEWHSAERLLSRLSLVRAPESNLDSVMPIANGCAAMWNNTRDLSSGRGNGAYVPVMYAHGFETDKWSSGVDAPIAPARATGVVVKGNTLLLAGSSRDDIGGGADWQTYRISCDQVLALSPARSMYLPTRAPSEARADPAKNIVSPAPAALPTYLGTWKQSVMGIAESARKHVQSTLLFGGLLLLLLIRFADRWGVYQVDDDGSAPGRVIDLAVLAASLCVLLLAFGAPWATPRTLVVIIAASMIMFVSKRLWTNISLPRNKVLLGVPLGVSAVLCAVAVGSIISGRLHQIIDSLRDF